MSTAQIAIQGLGAFLVLVFLYAGTFFFLFLERFVQARVQHREGPGRQGSIDFFQVWKDFVKVRARRGGEFFLPGRFKLALGIWSLLPAFFLLILLADLAPLTADSVAFPLLLLLPLLGTTIEALFLHAATDARERLEWRRRMVLRLMGATLLALSFLSASLQVGLPSLSAITQAQAVFPFHAMLSSPGLFLCAIASFGSIFVYAIENPIQNEGELSLGRSRHYLIFFVRRTWIYCLIGFWVYIFLGGISTIGAKIAFPIKLAVALFVFTLLQSSFPRMKSSDAAELAARWLFRLCLIGFLAEVLWVGVLG